MPFGSVLLRPGVNVEQTATLNEAGYTNTRYGRFRDGLFQKMGGWVRYVSFAVSGIPRALHAWQDLNETGHLAVGATLELAILTNGTQEDITPQTLVSDFAPNFTTTLGSATVTVDDLNIDTVTTYDSVFFNTPVSVGGIILSGLYQIALVSGATTYEITAATEATASVANGGDVPAFTTATGSATVTVDFPEHGLLVGDRVAFQIPTSVGGLTVVGSYIVTQVGTVNQFTIAASAQATSSATVSMNSGDAQIVYYIAVGPPSVGVGFGINDYGEGDYGLGTKSNEQTGDPIAAVDWTLDNWGEILVACPLNGGVYYWSPTGGFSTARLVSGAPIFNAGIFVSTQAQILVAWGSSESQNIGVDQNALLLRWSDMENFESWTVSTTSQAGFYRIPTGSRIVGCAPGSKFDLIWTDIDLWIMQYVGAPYVYTFNQVGTACGLIAEGAQTTFRGITYWMGSSNFFAYGGGGGVQVIPCPVWDAVFQDLDTDNARKIRCCPNSLFDEITWEYPSLSGGAGENDSTVTYNVTQGVWYINAYPPRTAWVDQSVLGNPIGTNTAGQVFQHEEGYDADGSPLVPVMTTGYFYLGEGQDFPFVDQWIPDFKWGTFNGAQTAQLYVTFNVIDWPGDTPRTYGPYSYSVASQYITTRFRGRQVSLTITSTDIGSFWRIGRSRYRWAAKGRR